MIQLIIKDGLGNQMFQYAYARCLQEQYRKQGKIEVLAINPYFIDHREFKDNDARKMSLQHLKLNKDIEFVSRKDQKKAMDRFKIQTFLSVNPIALLKWRIRGVKPKGKENFESRVNNGIYYAFDPYTEYGMPLTNKKNKFVFGFFQTEKNFLDIRSIVRDELLVKDTPSDANRLMIDQISQTNAVCLHIRRGDYLNPRWKNLQVCNFEYYNNSINYILERVEDPVFYVFSNTHDDLEWIKANYHFKDITGKKEIKLVYVDLGNPDYEELRLMYSCKHFIISNSTFSWWGAYLSANSSKLVLVPERWNLSDENDTKVYLSEWIKISNR